MVKWWCIHLVIFFFISLCRYGGQTSLLGNFNDLKEYRFICIWVPRCILWGFYDTLTLHSRFNVTAESILRTHWGLTKKEPSIILLPTIAHLHVCVHVWTHNRFALDNSVHLSSPTQIYRCMHCLHWVKNLRNLSSPTQISCPWGIDYIPPILLTSGKDRRSTKVKWGQMSS